MNEEDLKAVRKCILDKWHVLVQEDFYHEKLEEPECALCVLDNKRVAKAGSFDCTQCPIMRYTGGPDCINTPYHDWLISYEDALSESSVADPITLAEEELKFLLGFIPKGETLTADDGTEYVGTGEAYNQLVNKHVE